MNFCMLRSVKNIFWMLAMLACAQSAVAWTPIGTTVTANTSDAWQIPAIGYNVGGAEPGTPKDIHEAYRRNMPVIYYSFDESFWQYFGTNGVIELEKAFAMYNRVGKTSLLDVNDYPEDSRRVNYTAQTLGLFDLKSFAMGLITTEVGLFEPSRWVWALNGRQQLQPPNPPCPFNMEYTVYQRNYPATFGGLSDYPTVSYVNGVLYSYFIDDACTGGGQNVRIADAIEFPVDPLTQPYSAIADYSGLDYAGLLTGDFYTMLTRDDVAGLKYLYDPNNLHREAAGARVTEFVTNDISQAQVITTQDLGALAAASRTSTAAQLQAQFPGITVLTTSNYFGLQITTNITEFLINTPLDPAGAPATHPFFTTNYTTNVVQFFTHTFGNIVTNSYSTVGIVGTVSQMISNSLFAPAGAPPTTNTVVKFTPVNGVFGDFFTLPAGACSVVVLSNILTTVTPVTNLPTPAPSTVTGNTNAVNFTPGSVTFPTNHTLIILPVTCPLNRVARHGGADQLVFIARPYDSIVGQVWDPVTNDYTLPELDETNGVMLQQHFQRRVPRPDFLFSTADLAGQNTVVSYTNTVDNVTASFTITVTGVGTALGFTATTAAYDTTGRPGNQAGPGTIIDGDPVPKLFVLNRIAPSFDNLSATSGTTNTFLDPTEADQATFSAWGSFDGTTNLPVVYPNGTTAQSLLNLILGPQSNTPTLPNGTIGQFYNVQLAAKSGTAPYSWSLAPNSPGLPAGLQLHSDGSITGVPSGPAAIYDFTVRITDSAGKSRDVQYTITIS
jgi:hypothetical protein